MIVDSGGFSFITALFILNAMKPLSYNPSSTLEAGREITRDFCTPTQPERRSKRSLRLLAEADSFSVETPFGPVITYDWEPSQSDKPIVLLCHGWSDSAATWIAFIGPLRQAGFRPIAFDQPAHAATFILTGQNETIFPRMMLATRAVMAHAASLGTVHAMIGHSVGALGAFLTACELPPGRLVCIALPGSVPWFVDFYADYVGMADNVREELWSHLRHRFHGDMGPDFDPEAVDAASRAADLSVPSLFIQDSDDREVPMEVTHEVVKALHETGATVDSLDTEGLGHQLLLRAPRVIGRVLEFLQED